MDKIIVLPELPFGVFYSREIEEANGISDDLRWALDNMPELSDSS